MQRVQDLLKADGVCYIESTGDDGDWEVRSSARSEEHWRQVTVSQSIIQLALRQNASILTTDPLNDERFDPGKSIVLQRITSAMANVLALYLRKSRLETEARQKNRLAVIGEVVAGLAQAFPKVTKGVFLTFSTAQRAQKGPASDSRS